MAADNVIGFLTGRPVDPSRCVNPDVLAIAMKGHS